MTMAATYFDPYRNYRFRLKMAIDGDRMDYVAGLNKCSALKRTTEVTQWREGGDPNTSHALPGKTKYEPVTLEQGITFDLTFEKWANLVHSVSEGLATVGDFRRDIRIEVYTQAGGLALAYNLFKCWVSEYQALPDLDANANAVAIAHVKLELEGWERDTAVLRPDVT